MGCLEWMGLPIQLRRKIAHRIGDPVTEVAEQSERDSVGFAGIVVTRAAVVYIKAIRTTDAAAVSVLRRELRTNRYLPGSAPRILWQLESMEWLIIAYEHVPGMPAILRPGSPDLSAVVSILLEITQHRAAQIGQFEPLAARWGRLSPWRTLATSDQRVGTPWDRQHHRRFIDLERYALDVLSMGTTVAHTDIHEQNIRIAPHDARLINWDWCCSAPAWVDPAIVAVRLVAAGHTPAQAETLLTAIPAWNAAAPDALTAFAVAHYGLWRLNSRWQPLTDAAQQYAAYRLAVSSPEAQGAS